MSVAEDLWRRWDAVDACDPAWDAEVSSKAVATVNVSDTVRIEVFDDMSCLRFEGLRDGRCAVSWGLTAPREATA